MTQRIRTLTMTAAIAAVTALTSTVWAKEAHTVTVSQVEARTTFKDIQVLALSTAKEAEQLVTFTRNITIDADAHRSHLVALKNEINTMGVELAGLQSRRGSLDATEQATIDKVLPLLRETAANVESATRFYNLNFGHFWSPSYRASVEKAATDAEQIVKAIQNCRKYEVVHGEAQRLDEQLGVSASE